MKTYVDNLLEEYGAVPITAKEARELTYGKKPALKFNIRHGSPRKLDKIAYKADINNDAVLRGIDELQTMTNKPKIALPLFSTCIDDKMTAIILDIENGTSLEQMIKSLEDFEYIAWFSASSEVERPHLRLVIPLNEDVPAEEYDYCKQRLFDAFLQIPDIHSFESKRFFFLPSKVTGYYREDNEIVVHSGNSIDFYATTNFTPIDKMNIQIEKAKKSSETDYRCVIDSEAVDYYLNTDFPYISGNGNSDSSLYAAIVTCLANDDDETLEAVLEKARNEKWTEKELKRKIKSAQKFLGL